MSRFFQLVLKLEWRFLFCMEHIWVWSNWWFEEIFFWISLMYSCHHKKFDFNAEALGHGNTLLWLPCSHSLGTCTILKGKHGAFSMIASHFAFHSNFLDMPKTFHTKLNHKKLVTRHIDVWTFRLCAHKMFQALI